MKRVLVVIAVALGGCSSNPCDGRGASCVNALVEGYTGALDQLRISIDKPSPSSTATPNPPAAFTLPVKVALVLPAGATGDVSVGIDGLSGGEVVASGAPRTVSLPTSGTVTFTLAAGAGGDGGAEDMAIPPADLAGVVSIVPTSFNFAIDRGTSDMKTFHFGNGSDAAVAATATLSGGAEFTIATDGCAGAMIAPGAGCDVTVKFAPTTSGTGKSAGLTIAGAMSSITGDANPAWTSESPAVVGTRTLYALASLTATQRLAGGKGPAPSIFANSGTTWSSYSAQPPDVVNSMSPSDGGTLLVASPSGVYRGKGSSFTNEFAPADGGTGPAMSAVIAGLPFGDIAVGSTGIFRYTAGAWINDGPGHGDGGIPNVTAVASDGTYIYVVASAALYRGQPMSPYTPYAAAPVPLPNGVTLTGVWVPSGAAAAYNVWMVANNATIWHVDSMFPVNGSSPMSEVIPAGVAGSLNAIHGFRSGSTLALVAVGNGGVILRSSGNGTWTQDKSPTTANLNAVLVTSLTEAYAVGESGTILHYY